MEDTTACNYDANATEDDGSCYTAVITQNGDMIYSETNGNPNGLDVNWYNTDGTSSWLMDVDQSAYAPTFDCTYYISWDDDNGCPTTSAHFTYMEMAARIGQIITYPNPVKDMVSLEFNNHKNQNVKFELIDNNGNKMDEFITPNNKLEIDLSKYPSGVYYISFDATNNTDGCITQEKQKTLTKIILNK
jgi:hypothetical protein